jgi:hypothetical protein
MTQIRGLPETPDCPVCVRCRTLTRLVGIEPHPTYPRADLYTFSCVRCNELQTQVLPAQGLSPAALSGQGLPTQE